MAKKKHAWPTKSIRAFAKPRRGTRDRSFHIDQKYWFYPVHAGAFKEAAEMVIDAHLSQRLNQDALFYPVAYLYRHCLEVKLKDLIRIGIKTKFFKPEEVKKMLKKHDLIPLWTEVRRFLEHEWPQADPKPLVGIDKVVKQFNDADPDGQTLRYERNNDGEFNLQEKLPEHIDIKALRRTMDGVYNLLDASESMIRDYLSEYHGP